MEKKRLKLFKVKQELRRIRVKRTINQTTRRREKQRREKQANDKMKANITGPSLEWQQWTQSHNGRGAFVSDVLLR